MKSCLVCNYEDKDNSSLFCSNCGTPFKDVSPSVSKTEEEVSTKRRAKKGLRKVNYPMNNYLRI